MAVTFDASTDSGTFTNVASKTFTHTPVGTPDYVRVSVGWAVLLSAATTASVTYGGTSMTSVGSNHDDTFNGGVVRGIAQIFELVAPAGGAQSVVVTFSAGGNYGDAGATTYIGVHQTTPSGTPVTGNAVTQNFSVTVSSNSSDMVSDCAIAQTQIGGYTATQTQDFQAAGDVGGASYWGMGSHATGAASTVMGWNGVSGGTASAQIAVAILHATAGGNTLISPLGSSTLSGLTPAFGQGHTIAAPLGSETLTGLVPSFSQGNTIVAPLGSLALSGLTPAFGQGNTITAPLGALTLNGLAATFDQGQRTLEAPLGSLSLVGLAAAFSQSGTGAGSLHSWFVKGIGIKTKISVNSQVDGDIGDTP